LGHINYFLKNAAAKVVVFDASKDDYLGFVAATNRFWLPYDVLNDCNGVFLIDVLKY
jgi:hypothetical protein